MATNEYERAFHHVAERHERIWVFLSLVLLAVLLAGSMFYVVIDYGVVVKSGTTSPPLIPAIDESAFEGGKVVQTGPNSYAIYVVGRVWSWSPGTIHVKQGALVTFYVTSSDVLHGFEVQGTTINVTAIPGAVSSVTYTFNHAGIYQILCNEFCGIEHQAMTSKIIVDPKG